MERDIKDGRTFTSLADKLYFMCELSWEMLSTEHMSLNYREFPDRLRRLFGHAVQEQKDLDHWHYDMMGQTMLIRNSDGDYSPAHRSLLEFFVAYKFAAELGVLAPDFTELARVQVFLDTNAIPQDYTYSEYFQQKIDDTDKIKPKSLLQEFITEDVVILAETVGRVPINKAVLELINNMLDPDTEKIKTRLLTIITETRGKSSQEVGFIGGNVATVLIRYNKQALKGCDLYGVDLKNAILARADLTGCTLDHANLSDVIFDDTVMINVGLQQSNLGGVELGIVGSWILNIGPSDNHSIIHFYYPYTILEKDQPVLPFNILDDEIVIGFEENKALKWTYRVKTSFIAAWEKWGEDLLQFLTIEGEVIALDLNTGQKVEIESECRLLRWRNADLTNATGLDQRNIHLLKILGAVNLLDSSYDPCNDQDVIQRQKSTTTNFAHQDSQG